MSTMKQISSLFQGYATEKTKHDFEYQEVCTELEPVYGKLIWTLPFKKGVTEHKIKEAHGIAKSRGILKFNYLFGIIKRL